MRPQYQKIRFSLGGSFTPMVKVLMWINGLTYLFLFLVGQKSFLLETSGGGIQLPYGVIATNHLLGLIPRAVLHEHAYWQLITYMFLHGGLWHILINMLCLWWFGADIERVWGSRRFLRFYFFCGIGAGLVSLLASRLFTGDMLTPTMGASGAVYGVMLAYGLMFPNRIIYLYFVFPVKAKYCIAGLLLLSLWFFFTSDAPGISHSAHLGGAMAGGIWILFAGRRLNLPELWRRFYRWRMRRRLRVVKRRGEGDDDDDSLGSYDNKTIH